MKQEQANQANNNNIYPIKDLSFLALFALIFGSMMGSGVFDIPQNVAHRANSLAVLISWCITAIGVFSLSWVLIYITIKRPDIKSGIYGYAKHGFGDYIGFNSAWGYWLNALLGNASYLIYIFATLGDFAIFKFFGAGNTLESLYCQSILIWVIYFIIYKGINVASFINIAITSIKILALVTVILFFLFYFNYKQFLINLSSTNLTLGSLFIQIKSTMLVTVWDFLGIEAACIYALRAKNMKDVARATMFGVGLVFVIDALLSILPFGIINATQISSLSTPSTASLLAIITGNVAIIPSLIRIAVIVSVAGALLAWSLLATNIAYLAASDQTFPKQYTFTNKNLVPSKALFLSMITLQVFLIMAHMTNAIYLVMIQLATSLALIPYILSILFAIKILYQEKTFIWSLWFKGLIAIVYGIWLIYAGGIKYLSFASSLACIGIIVYLIARIQYNRKIFETKFEKFVMLFIVLITIMANYMLYTANIKL